MFTVEVTSGGQAGIKTLMISVIPTNDLGPLNFALIPAGTFQMGRPNGFDYEKPVHSVTLTKSFYMQRAEVTQGQWKAVMGDNPSWFPNCGDACPVEEVSWFDIQSFLAALNAANPGMNYRLPTEAEWEYAARAGTTGDHYLESGNLDQMAWYTGNICEETHYVGLKEPNPWGLYDMYGNVWEWVNDWQYDYSEEPETDPTGPLGGALKGTRGGGWMTDSPFMDSGRRSYSPPSSIYNDMGFRLVRTN